MGAQPGGPGGGASRQGAVSRRRAGSQHSILRRLNGYPQKWTLLLQDLLEVNLPGNLTGLGEGESIGALGGGSIGHIAFGGGGSTDSGGGGFNVDKLSNSQTYPLKSFDGMYLNDAQLAVVTPVKVGRLALA